MATATFATPFDLQVEFLRRKLDLPTATWRDIWQGAHDQAFVVAGAAKADLVADLHAAVVKAAAEGRGIADFRKDFDKIVANHGWTGWTGQGTAAGEAWRTKTIYQTNMATSHAAGRWAQINDPDLAAFRPYIMYHHADGVMHPRPQHLSWNGLVLPKDHPFWRTHATPNGWGCHCWLSAAGKADYERAQAAGKTAPPAGWDEINPKTGAPVGIDKGWAYAPGASRAEELQRFAAEKVGKLPAQVGAALAAQTSPVVLAERTRAFGEFVDVALAGPARGRLIVTGALKPSWVAAADEAGLAPVAADISVRDEDVRHTFRPGKEHPLDLDWYKRLPEHLDAPGAVILDATHPAEPAFLLVYGQGEGRADKLVVRINYRVKKAGLGNIVQTGKAVTPEDIRAQIGQGYTLVEGSL